MIYLSGYDWVWSFFLLYFSISLLVYSFYFPFFSCHLFFYGIIDWVLDSSYLARVWVGKRKELGFIGVISFFFLVLCFFLFICQIDPAVAILFASGLFLYTGLGCCFCCSAYCLFPFAELLVDVIFARPSMALSYNKITLHLHCVFYSFTSKRFRLKLKDSNTVNPHTKTRQKGGEAGTFYSAGPNSPPYLIFETFFLRSRMQMFSDLDKRFWMVTFFFFFTFSNSIV